MVWQADPYYVLQRPADVRLAEVGQRLGMVPAGIRRRDGEELALVREGELRPGLDDDVISLLEVGPVAFLVLDTRAVGEPQDLHLARLVAAAHPNSTRPPLITSSMAPSSATRSGCHGSGCWWPGRAGYGASAPRWPSQPSAGWD